MDYFNKLRSYIFNNEKEIETVNNDTDPSLLVVDKQVNDSNQWMNEAEEEAIRNRAIDNIRIDEDIHNKRLKWEKFGFNGIDFDDKGNEISIELNNPYGSKINYLKGINMYDFEDNDNLRSLAKEHDVDYDLVKALSYDNYYMDDNPSREVKIIKELSDRSKNEGISNIRDIAIAYKKGPAYVFGDKKLSSKEKEELNMKFRGNVGYLDSVISGYTRFKDVE